MGEAFITRRGGGIPYAIIGVTYPSGSVCTCTSGSRTMTAKDTSGKALFVIPEAGTWTVKAVSGSKTASKAVSITTEGQVENVTLSYALDIFAAGKGVTEGFTIKCYDEDNGWEISSEKIIWSTQTYAGNRIWVTPTLNLSAFNTLKVDYKCNDRYAEDNPETLTFGVGPDEPLNWTHGEYTAKTVVPYSTSRKVTSVDISKITATTKYYIKIEFGATVGELYNIWLE